MTHIHTHSLSLSLTHTLTYIHIYIFIKHQFKDRVEQYKDFQGPAIISAEYLEDAFSQGRFTWPPPPHTGMTIYIFININIYIYLHVMSAE